MSFPNYPKYKDTEIEWLGKVPEHWRVQRLKWSARINAGQSPPSDAVGEIGGGLPFLQGNAEFGELYPTPRLASDAATKRAAQGDILLSVRAPVGEMNVADQQYGIGRGLCALRPSPDLDSGYFFYMLMLSRNQLDAVATGSTYDAVTASDIGDLPMLLPPLSEQRAVAEFLHASQHKSDALIAKQQRLIELLKEKRQAIISHAVTKGLNSHAPMKASGFEWLGEVPAHWHVEKMKWVARMESGHTPDKKVPEYWEACDIPWVSLNDTGYLKDHDYISETAYYINELGIANSSARLLPARVVVFSRDATIGRCAITERPMAVSQHFIAWICSDKLIPEYLLLRLRSMTQELERLTTGATLKTIGMSDVRTIVTPLPPLEEQVAIVKYVAESAAAIDSLVRETERIIELLQERRAALISAAVTGKIDVRHLADAEAA